MAIIENRILRQTSIIIDNSINIVQSNKNVKSEIYEVNNDRNSLIRNNLINFFPEYKYNSVERLKKIIVSITSYKPRLNNLDLIIESIFNNTMKPFKIVLTLFKKDIKFITKNLKELIKNNIIELIVTNIDLKSHKKYFNVMKKYRDYAIITIDDDIIYTNDLIESLYNSYIKYPNYIHARRVHKIIIENNKLLPYDQWIEQYTFELNPSFFLFVTSGAGTLFPPNILNISDDNINDIYKCLTADDIYINYLSRKKNIKIVWVPNKYPLGLARIRDEYALFKMNKEGERLNDAYLKIFPLF